MRFQEHFRNHLGAADGLGHQIERLPQLTPVDFRDFSAGYVLSVGRKEVPAQASPKALNIEVTDSNRLRRAPGTTAQEAFEGRSPQLLAVHGSLDFTAELLLFDPPYLGVSRSGTTEWANRELRDALSRYAYTNFGGTFIFGDGSKVYARQVNSGTIIEEVPEAPIARTYASWAGRVWGGDANIDENHEPLGVVWSAANSNYTDWTGTGAGNELLLSEISAGDRVIALRPMGLDFMATLLRNSIWVATRTGLAARPGDFRVRVPGVGPINEAVCCATRFGVVFLSDDGVFIFDGNTVHSLSESIDKELLPLDYEAVDRYKASFDPTTNRYILHTPEGSTWVCELTQPRWFKRSLNVYSSVVVPEQVDYRSWEELLGTWAEQEPALWLDYGGASVGKARLLMLGDDLAGRRSLDREDRASDLYFGHTFEGTWETGARAETLLNELQTIMRTQLEVEGNGSMQLWTPDIRGVYVQLLAALVSVPELDVIEFRVPGTGRLSGLRLKLLSGGLEVEAIQFLVQKRGPRIATAEQTPLTLPPAVVPQPADTDWGQIAVSLIEDNDWGLITELVVSAQDWGLITDED